MRPAVNQEDKSNIMKNFHLIKISYLPATDTTGATIRLSSKNRCKYMILDRNYKYEAREQAIQYLTHHGFNIVGCSGDTIITDTFKNLK